MLNIKSLLTRKRKKKYELNDEELFNRLIKHPLTKTIGKNNRIGDYDFWKTGTVMNCKTKEFIDMNQLLELADLKLKNK